MSEKLKSRDGRESRESREAGSHRRTRLSGSDAVELAKRHRAEQTSKEPESVSALQRSRDGWSIRLEVVELERIPQSTDIMASYQVELDEQGELVSYERVARYYRNQASSEE